MQEKDYNKYNKGSFAKAQNKAEKVANNPNRLKKLLDNAWNKMDGMDDGGNGKKVSGLIGYLKQFVRMVRAYVKGEYRQLSWKTLLTIVAGLIYFVTPFDFVPDFIPFAGFLDDATVMLWIFNRFKHDIAAFEEWEATDVKVAT